MSTMTVTSRFNGLLNNVKLTETQKTTARTRYKNVTKILNQHYYSSNSEISNSLLIGSWGKHTQIRPPRDIDILFQLPPSVYERFSSRLGNKQSQILQEVKAVLAAYYPNATTIKSSGPIVAVDFVSYAVEVLPAFSITNDRFLICETKDGGKYKTIDPKAEQDHISVSNTLSKGNTRDLIRMAKCWQYNCTVSIDSFELELLAVEFLKTWQYRGQNALFYDFMFRDFMVYLNSKDFHYFYTPGMAEYISVWTGYIRTKINSAYSRAVKAIEYQTEEMPCNAGAEWQKIFGTYIPQC